MKYVVCEVVRHYHEVDTEHDDIDMEKFVDIAKLNVNFFNSGYESLDKLLEEYKEKYDIEYSLKPNFCGTEVEDMYIVNS